jgi:3-deoxy-D-manno-octulosonate 8-phosphate phosphatase (KDO 8-P phosphatase)
MLKSTKLLFKNIKLLVLDVDGVLTRGEIIYDSDGKELKIFNVKDGLGIALLSKVGFRTVLLTAKDSPVVHRRALDMKVAQVIGGILPKESVLESLKADYKVKETQICFIGDDLIDIGLMEKVGLSVAPADAPAIVKKSAAYITKARGGEGAVREVIDLIIASQGLEKKILQLLK